MVATLAGERVAAEELIDESVRLFNAAHAEAVARADRELKDSLATSGCARQLLAKNLAEAETALERIRKRTSKRTESLFSLLNDDLRQQ